MPRAVIATLPEPVQIAEILGLPRPGSFDDIKLVDCDSAHTDNFSVLLASTGHCRISSRQAANAVLSASLGSCGLSKSSTNYVLAPRG